jgi:hypothetical protein
MKAVVALAGCLMVAGCATQTLQTEKVGPSSGVAREAAGEGRLIVYSATEQVVRADVAYQVHSSYQIYREDKSLLKTVRNHRDDQDETPELVSLPAGSYTVKARAAGAGLVAVPVLVQDVKTTEVHLQGSWKPAAAPRSDAELVRLPTGQCIGWRAPLPLDERKTPLADAIVKARLVRSPDVAGVAAYALFETEAIIRNNTEQAIGNRFTVGSSAIDKDFPPGVSILYLKLLKRGAGAGEWFLVAD